MSLPQQKFREAVFQMLYTQSFETDSAEMVPFMMGELKATRKSMILAQNRVCEVMAKLAEIDPMIQKASTEYSFDRISRVEKTIIRLGLFEILFDTEVPAKVAISEAVRLCRKFATAESSQFVNAILDGVFQNDVASSAEQSVSV